MTESLQANVQAAVAPAPKPRVLVADDSAVSRMLALHYLKGMECTAEAVATGTGAVESWRENRHDLILMDCLMEDLNGFAAAEKIRAIEGKRRSRIVAVTGDDSEANKRRCLEHGMDDLIQKPVRQGALAALVMAASLTVPIRAVSPDEIAELRGDGDHLLERMACAWNVEAPALFGEMCVAARENKPEEVARAGHRLKGSACCFGAERVRRLAHAVEKLFQEGLSRIGSSLLPELELAIQAVSTALELELRRAA